MEYKELDIITCEPVELLKELVRFQSLSTQEGELVNWLEDRLKKTELFAIERYGDNLIISIGRGRPWLLLNSHSDVVPPSPNHYQDPFAPFEENGRVYGRGTTDAKGCSTCMIKALIELALEGFNPTGKVSFALTVCEETSGDNNGMHYLMNTIKLKPDAAIIGEPTLLEPCIAQKGLLVVKIITYGDSGHAARSYGKNAIYGMARVLEQLKTITFPQENPFVGHIKITPTRISGGTAHNASPEKCELIVDIRTIPEVPNALLLSKLNKELEADVELISDRFVSMATSGDSKIARICRDVSDKAYFGSPTASDWVFLHDIPTVKFGPGNSECSHTADEYIDIEQIQKGVSMYKSIIMNYLKQENK